MSVSRLDACFQHLREQQRKALIPFITAGDPRWKPPCRSCTLVDAGADVIELGVPFSDPMADGPTIQRSSERALAREPAAMCCRRWRSSGRVMRTPQWC